MLNESVIIDSNKTKVEIKLEEIKFKRFKVRIFVNDVEIRPTTLVGIDCAQNYWNLLKKSCE